MTALRSLMIELGLSDGVSNKLRGIDAHVSGLESGLTGTKKEFSALEYATKDYGYTAGKELSGVGKGISELDKQVVNHADTTTKATESIEKRWAKVGAAIGAAGVAGEAFVRSQQDNYFIAGKVAYRTGIEKREVAALASELTSIGMPIDDVYGAMEIGSKQGLKTPDEFREYVAFYDNFGTAAEEDPLGLARQALGLRSVGIEAEDLTDSYGALGFMLENTQWRSSQFLGTIGYIARDMDKLDMSIDDVAIVLTALDRYRGITPENAQRVLRTAMSKSDGDLNAFYRELRITDEQITQLRSEYGGGAEYIAMVNEEYAGSRSSLQFLEVELSRVTNLIGADFLPVIGASSAVLGGLSSALLTAASAKYIFAGASIKTLIPSLTAATASAWGFTTALLANPLTWVVVGVVAAGAAIYTLATNWDTVSEKATGAMTWMKDAWDSTVGALTSKTEWFTDRMDYLMLLCPITAPIGAMHLLRDNWDEVTGSIGGTWDKLVDTSKQSGAWFTEATKDTLSGATDLFWQYHPLGIVISHWDDITGYLESIDLSDTGRNILLGLLDGILDVRDQTFDTVLDIGEGIEDTIKDFFGIRSPSKLMQEMGGFVGQGFQLGIDQSMPGTIPLPEVMGQSGVVDYQSHVSGPTVHDLVGTIAYGSTLDRPEISDLVGRVDYFGGMYTPTEDVGPSLPDVDAFGDYTPERDVQYFTSRQGDIVYSTEINIDGTGQDSRELAATIDRRIRQTFDRHAEVYFARQRRRMA